MGTQMKPEGQNKRLGSASALAESTVEPEAIEEFDDEYDDELEAEPNDQSAQAGEDEPFGSKHALDAAAKAKEEEFVRNTVEKINEMYRRGVDNGKLEIGGYLLDEVFEGNIEDAISTNPYKSATFAGIAKSPRLEVEPKTLGAWVRAAAVNRDFGSKGLRFARLTTYHLGELAKVKDEARRAEIANEADEKGLTVKELRKLVREVKRNGKNDSDTIKQEVEKTMKNLAELGVSEDFLGFVGDKEAIREIYSPGKALDLIPEVYASLENVQAAAEVLETFANNLDEIVNETRKRRSA
jgi:hypothetical protein